MPCIPFMLRDDLLKNENLFNVKLATLISRMSFILLNLECKTKIKFLKNHMLMIFNFLKIKSDYVI